MLSDRPRLWGGAATMPCTNHPRSSDSCYVLVSFLPEKKQLYAYVCSRHTFAHVARSNRQCSPPASLYAISNAVTHTPTIYIYKLSTPIRRCLLLPFISMQNSGHCDKAGAGGYNETTFVQTMEALISTGLDKLGYVYLNADVR